MINISDLTELDFQILQKIADNPQIDIIDLQKLFPDNKSIMFRVNLLSEFINSSEPNLPSIVSPKNYLFQFRREETVEDKLGWQLSISALGLKALEDRLIINKKAKFKLYEDRFWKAVAGLALIKSFLPEITEILSSLLQFLKLLTQLI